MNELVRTPLGLSATVLGVRCVQRLNCISFNTRSPACQRRHASLGSAKTLTTTKPHDERPFTRYEEPSQKESGRIWVRYDNGHEAPLEPKQAAGSLNLLGWVLCECCALGCSGAYGGL